MIKIWPGMSLGDFLCQDVPDDWPDEEFYARFAGQLSMDLSATWSCRNRTPPYSSAIRPIMAMEVVAVRVNWSSICTFTS